MRFILSASIILLLAGCSSSPSPVLPPLELTPLENKISLTREWIFTLGEGIGDEYLKLRPAIHNKTGYAVDHKGYLSAFDINTSEQLWDFNLDMPVSGGLTFFNKALYLGNSNGEVIAFDADNLKVIWRAQLSSEILSRPVIANGIVIAKTINGRIHGLNLLNGNKLWMYEYSVPQLTLRGNSTPVIINDVVLMAADNGKVTALTLQQGKVLWETSVAIAQGRNQLERIVDMDVTPVVVDGVAYVASYQGRLAAINISSGEIIWNRDFSTYSGLSVDDYRVYVTDAAGQIWALNRYNGSTVWRQDKFLRRQLTAPSLQEDYIVFGDYDGYLHWLSREDGKLIARIRLNTSDINFEDAEDPEEMDKKLQFYFSKPNNILVQPIVLDKIILSLDRAGHLEAFQIGKAN